MMTTMLSYCPACVKLISVEAKSCPHCGLPITLERRKRMIAAEEARVKRIKEERAKREEYERSLLESAKRREKERKKKYPDTGDGR